MVILDRKNVDGVLSSEHSIGVPKISPIRVCFTSKSSAGAWKIRGEQFASMRSNWVAINRPNRSELMGIDLVCFVKKPSPDVLSLVRELRIPFVLDIVDSWAQPNDGLAVNGAESARNLFAPVWKNIDADAYIFPNRRMERDLGSLVGSRTVIYHHYWPNIPSNPVRETVSTIGYEGADYLGEWEDRIRTYCSLRGVRFVINPISYSEMDVVVIVRGGVHGNFLARNYKSNVKVANAFGSGTPAVVHCGEFSAQETDNGDIYFFSDQRRSLERQLDLLVEDFDRRKNISARFLEAAFPYSIQRITDQIESFFISVKVQKLRGQL